MTCINVNCTFPVMGLCQYPPTCVVGWVVGWVGGFAFIQTVGGFPEIGSWKLEAGVLSLSHSHDL